MDLHTSEEEGEVKQEHLDISGAKKMSKADYSDLQDLHLKRMEERSIYMKRLSSRSGRESKVYSKPKVSLIIGDRGSREHVIKAIERTVLEMADDSQPQDQTRPDQLSNAPEAAQDTTEPQFDDQRSRKMTISDSGSMRSKRRYTVSLARDSLTMSQSHIVTTKMISDYDFTDLKSLAPSLLEEYSKSIEKTPSQRDIENIAAAIQHENMPKTASDESLAKAALPTQSRTKLEKVQGAIPETETKELETGHTSETDSGEHISNLNFRISDTELPHLINQASMRQVTKHIHLRGDYMPLTEFERVVKNLYKCCLKSVTDLHELHLRRLLALPIISDIIARADPEYINTAHIIHMIWSVMSCLHHFQLRLKSGSNSLVMHTRQRMVDKCMDYYLQLIRLFKPTVHRIILSAIITFYKDGKLWDIEFACTDMIVALLDIYTDIEDGVNDLLNSAIHATTTNLTEAQKLMQVIYEVLRSVKWRSVSRKIIDRLIFLLENSISPKEGTQGHLYAPLRMGINLCIRHMITNISNMDVMILLKRLLKRMVSEDVTEGAMLNFGNLASYAAAKFQMKTYHTYITPDLLSNFSLLVHDINNMTFLTAMRIWLNLMDRHGNSSELNKPKIFFRGCHYEIRMRKNCNRHDRIFFKAHRNYFYDLITDCYKQCSNSRIQMYIIFEMCAVLLVEIPCGYTAATFTSIAMSMQEHALHIFTENLVQAHYLHATALSILSLICYIHRAEVFYEYVTKIIDRRAEWAPHLIPPLKAKYEYALHHVLWSKPELFFEDWEARFGLWKCFRIKKKKNKKVK